MARVGIKYEVDARGAIRQIKEFGQATKRLAGQAAGAASQLGGLQGIIGRLALVETGRRATSLAASFKQTQLRLRLLSQEYGEYEKAQRLAAQASETFGLSTSEASAGIADIYARLRPIGVTLADIKSTYIGFNTAAKLSGVSAQQASGAFLQLAQALGSGRLQGDEFRSIAEQLPKLNQVIAKSMDVPIGQLKTLASQGKITSEIIIKALKDIEADGGEAIKGLMKEDPTQKFKNLSNAVEKLSIAIGTDLLTVVAPVTQALADAVNWVNDLPSPVKSLTVAILALTAGFYTLGPLIKAATLYLGLMHTVLVGKIIPALHLTNAAAGPIVLALAAIATGAVLLGNSFVQSKREMEAHTEALQTLNEATAKSSILLQEQTISKLESDKAWWGSRSWIPFASLKFSALSESLELANERLTQLKERLRAIPLINAAEKIEKANAAMKGLGKSAMQTDEQFKTVFAGKFQKYMQNVNDFGTQSANVVIKSFQGMEDALVKFVQGGKVSFRELANSIIADLIRIAVRRAILAPLLGGTGSMLSSLFSGGKKGGPGYTEWNTDMPIDADSIPYDGKAAGGPVSGGSSYLVGERGPEIFQPDRNGKIIPNGQIGGGTNVTVNVDATGGSEVQGDEPSASQLGRLIGAAVQAELIKQKRPGGILA